MTDVEKLQERVANGIRWLAEHDELGVFHLWFVAKINPAGPFPAHEDSDVPARYAEYHTQRSKWQRLSDALAKVDPGWRDTPIVLGHAQWQGDPGRIRTR